MKKSVQKFLVLTNLVALILFVTLLDEFRTVNSPPIIFKISADFDFFSKNSLRESLHSLSIMKNYRLMLYSEKELRVVRSKIAKIFEIEKKKKDDSFNSLYRSEEKTFPKKSRNGQTETLEEISKNQNNNQEEAPYKLFIQGKEIKITNLVFHREIDGFIFVVLHCEDKLELLVASPVDSWFHKVFEIKAENFQNFHKISESYLKESPIDIKFIKKRETFAFLLPEGKVLLFRPKFGSKLIKINFAHPSIHTIDSFQMSFKLHLINDEIIVSSMSLSNKHPSIHLAKLAFQPSLNEFMLIGISKIKFHRSKIKSSILQFIVNPTEGVLSPEESKKIIGFDLFGYKKALHLCAMIKGGRTICYRSGAKHYKTEIDFDKLACDVMKVAGAAVLALAIIHFLKNIFKIL